MTNSTTGRLLTCALLIVPLLAGCGAHKDASKATTQADSSSQTVATSAPPFADTTSAGNAASPEFPAGTELGALGLPVYPVPDIKKWTTIDAPSIADGKAVERTHISPNVTLVDFDTVYAWYKAHMPSGTETTNGDTPNAKGDQYATFRIGSDGDKVVRTVMVYHYAGDAQMSIALIRETKQ